MTPLTEAERRMVLDNMGLVRKEAGRVSWIMAKALLGHRPTGKLAEQFMEDLVQYGVLGLAVAVRKFDQTLGFQFSTYAFRWIRQSIQKGSYRMAFCVGKQQRKYLSLFSELGEETFDLWDGRVEQSGTGLDPELAALLDLAIGNERSVRVLRLHLFDGMMFKDISKELGVSKQRVSQIYDKAREKLHASKGFRQALIRQAERRSENLLLNFTGRKLA